MPHEWNNMIVVTKDELVPEFFPTREALKLKLWRDKKNPYGIRRARQGKGLGNEVLILYDTLPADIRETLGDPRKMGDCTLERYFREEAGAAEYFANARAGKKGYIPTSRQADYVLDASVLMAALRLRDAHIERLVALGEAVKNVYQYLSEAVNNFNRWRHLKGLPEHSLPTHYLSLKRKIERFEKDGYASLLKGYDNNNAGVKTEKIMKLLNALYARKDMKPTQVEVSRLYDAFLEGYVEVVNPETGELYDPSEYGKLSQRTVTAFLASWKEKVATHLVRAADRQQYMAKFDPFQSLQQPEYAGSIISVDDRQPPFEYAPNLRMWFYNAIDLGSECIIAFVYGKSKDGIILDFYRELVRNCAEWGFNMPAELECEAHLNNNFKDTFLREGCMFRFVRILANSAHSKRIERYYGNLRYQLEKQRAGWIGRPFARNEAYQRNGDKKETIPYDTLVQNCLEDIMTWNNSPHSKYPEKTRWEVFLEHQHPDLRPINWRGILPYIGERTQTSCKAGHIRLNSGWYLLGDDGEIYTGDRLLDLMEQVEGRDVEVYWLRGHQGQTLKALVYREGRLVCEALPKPVAKRSQLEALGDDDARQAFELVERYKNTVRGWARRHKNEIEKLVIIDNRPRTLNNKFVIPWADSLATDLPEETPAEVEVLEEPGDSPDADLNALSSDFKIPSIRERF